MCRPSEKSRGPWCPPCFKKLVFWGDPPPWKALTRALRFFTFCEFSQYGHMTDLMSSFFNDFLCIWCAGSFSRSLSCQNDKFLIFLISFAKSKKKRKTWSNLIFERFWEARGPYPGGKISPYQFYIVSDPQKPPTPNKNTNLVVLSNIFFLDLDTVWPQSRHTEDLQRREALHKKNLDEIYRCRLSGLSSSIIFHYLWQTFWKKSVFDENV